MSYDIDSKRISVAIPASSQGITARDAIAQNYGGAIEPNPCDDLTDGLVSLFKRVISYVPDLRCF